jgi:hypothetical protein
LGVRQFGKRSVEEWQGLMLSKIATRLHGRGVSGEAFIFCFFL